MDLEQKIIELAEAGLADESFFIVEVKISSGKQVKVSVLLDGDEGVTIDHCSALSRHLGARIEEENIIDSAYTLDVGSPGVDMPLKLKRQYVKNVGRKLKVKLNTGETLKGKLAAADDSRIVLSLKNPKEQPEESIEYMEIDWAKVQVSFNKN